MGFNIRGRGLASQYTGRSGFTTKLGCFEGLTLTGKP